MVCPAAANLTAREAAKLVFPTPPLPLIMMYLRFVPAAIASKELSALAVWIVWTCTNSCRETHLPFVCDNVVQHIAFC